MLTNIFFSENFRQTEKLGNAVKWTDATMWPVWIYSSWRDSSGDTHYAGIYINSVFLFSYDIVIGRNTRLVLGKVADQDTDPVFKVSSDPNPVWTSKNVNPGSATLLKGKTTFFSWWWPGNKLKYIQIHLQRFTVVKRYLSKTQIQIWVFSISS